MSEQEQTNTVTRLAIEGFRGRVRRHTTELMRLSGPIVVSRSGFLLLVFADTAMTGRFSAQELAYLAIALALIIPLIITALGMIMGTLVLTANAHGRGDHAACGPIWRRSLTYSLVLGVVCVIAGFFGEPVLTLMGQQEEVASRGGAVFQILTLGLPGHLLFLSSAYFLEGIGRPTPAMIVMIAANIINVGLNYILIYGAGDLPQMGADGAAWATTVTRLCMAFMMVAYVWNLKDHSRFGIRLPVTGGFSSWVELRRIGYAIGISVGVESLAFAGLNIMAGWLGKIPLAAYGMTLNYMALIFMIAIGVGSATTVRVGIAYGRGDTPDAELAGWIGLALNSVLMMIVALATWLFVPQIIGIYTDDPELVAEAMITIAFVVFILLPDGGQAVMANALRGRKDVWGPSFIQTASFFGVMVPFGYYSAFVMENGTVGLFHGILAGVVVSLILLCFRFHILSKRDKVSAPVQ